MNSNATGNASRQYSTPRGGIVSRGLPLVAPEDLMNLGIDPEFIPFIISTTLRDEKSPDISPPLNPAEAENLVESLHKVYLYLWISPRMLNSSTIRLCRPPWRIRA